MSTTIQDTHEQRDHADGVLSKAFQVLSLVGSREHPLSLAEISRETGLPKTTVHRVLNEMLRLGALEREGDVYRIGIQMFVLSSVVPEVQLRGLALQRLIELQRLSGQTLHLATMRNDRVVYLEKIGNRFSDDLPTVVGGSFAAPATGVGKAMLAYMPHQRLQSILERPLESVTSKTISEPQQLIMSLKKVREFGIALDDEEAAPKFRCVAHPIMHQGTAVAGVSISFPSNVPLEKSVVSALRAACTSIGNDLAKYVSDRRPARAAY